MSESLLGDGPERQAKLLARTLERIAELPAAVAFADEVEDLASIRHESRKVGPSVTNEFLKQIPRLRAAPHHLLGCATNVVGRLDPAFVRPGRFDYVLPVGPPESVPQSRDSGVPMDEGRDLAVSILDDEPLPVVEAVPRGEEFYDFEARYEIGRTSFVCPAELPDGVTEARVGDP